MITSGMAKQRDRYVEYLTEQLSPLGEIASRAMFGGHCLYCDGVVFALVAGSELYLKADDENRRMFEQRDLQPFKPFEDRDEVMSYYQAPPEIFEDPDAMRMWCGPAVRAGARSRTKKRKKRSTKAGAK